LSYAGPGGWYNSSGDRVVIVKVNPRDAVSVPGDHEFTKLRVCAYEVLCEYKAPLERSAYSSTGNVYEQPTRCQNHDDLFVDDDDEFDEDEVDYCEAEDMTPGNVYEFDYLSGDGWKHRRAYIEHAYDNRVTAILEPGDPSFVEDTDEDNDESNYRSFSFDRMEGVFVCDDV